MLRTAFRVVAVAEAISWAALLTAMFFKWVLGHDEAVAIPGMIHGWLFVGYIGVSLVLWREEGWSLRSGLLVLACGVIPFGTIWAERHVDRLPRRTGGTASAA
jgi:integral membrane protein